MVKTARYGSSIPQRKYISTMFNSRLIVFLWTCVTVPASIYSVVHQWWAWCIIGDTAAILNANLRTCDLGMVGESPPPPPIRNIYTLKMLRQVNIHSNGFSSSCEVLLTCIINNIFTMFTVHSYIYCTGKRGYMGQMGWKSQKYPSLKLRLNFFSDQ